MENLIIAAVRFNDDATQWWAEVYYQTTGLRVPYLETEGGMHATQEEARKEAEAIVARQTGGVLWK
jgi:hypothetical protein